MNKMKEHHLGIIVKNLEEDIEMYEQLGYENISEIYYDEFQKNKIVFMLKKGTDLLFELIEPIDSTSSICSAHLGYHHICYEVDSEEEIHDMFKCKGNGIIFLKRIKAVALDNRLVSFAMLLNGSIIEFLYK